ncbi:CvpA family protein [Devosia sp. ZB163]|uniref:CvpA family protein n=1 Tax=Devosia sp. ZB163 TaxID=3025938 RepID=UPI0023600294|nr:CvpA family protein [Devosia sp. ZB163]MDC9824016.1 CvpA family protein [Devosia sp. ZB163]
MLTAFDVGIGVLVLISAILATARGFTREVLSLATWAGSAAIAAYAYFNHKEIARQYIAEELVADIVTVGGTFIVALIILHLITMRIADFVVDSRIGPLDRTLGFVFGVARGVLIAVVVVVFGLWLMSNNLPSWARDSRSLPVLEDLGNSLIGMLPPDLEKQVTDLLHRGTGSDEEPPAEGTTQDAAPEEGTDQLENDAPLDAAPASNTR